MNDRLDVVVVGAGQAGLAMAYCLAQCGVSFVVIDGATTVGASWRARWDSLRLFTARPYNHLPGHPFPPGADRYPHKDEVADYLARYAERFALPLRLGTPVTRLVRDGDGFVLSIGTASISARCVVVATGPFQVPRVPSLARELDPSVVQLHSADYRRPDALPMGRVLVVGTGNSGAQIAQELSAHREVWLSGRRPSVIPRAVLGVDTSFWIRSLGIDRISRSGRLGAGIYARRRREPDPLVGLSLRALSKEHGVRCVPWVEAAHRRRVVFSDGSSLEPAAVIWATGYGTDFRWVEAPVFDEDGEPAHRRGVTAVEGLFFLGLRWLDRMDSALLGGVGRDAAYLADVISTSLTGARRSV